MSDDRVRSERDRFLRFLLVGGLNALFGYAVYGAALYSGFGIAPSLAVANISGILFNFVTSGRLVFRDKDLRKFPKFLLAYGLSWGIGVALIAGVSKLEPARLLAPFPSLVLFANRHRSGALDDFVAAVLLLPVSALVTYGLLRAIVYGPAAAAQSGTK